MNNKVHEIEVELTKKFKGKYLNEEEFADAVKDSTRRYFTPAGYGAKAFVDPYGKRIIKVSVVKV